MLSKLGLGLMSSKSSSNSSSSDDEEEDEWDEAEEWEPEGVGEEARRLLYVCPPWRAEDPPRLLLLLPGESAPSSLPLAASSYKLSGSLESAELLSVGLAGTTTEDGGLTLKLAALLPKTYTRLGFLLSGICLAAEETDFDL